VGEQNDLRVNVQTVSKDLQTVFVTASQAGKGPDLVMGTHDWIGNLVQNGAIDPLQLTDDTRAAFNELSITGVTYNGQVYGIPYAIENVVLFRNTDLAPEAPKTMEELVAKGKELKASGKTSEIMALPVGPNGDPYHMYPIYTSAGGYLFGKGQEGDYNPKDSGSASRAPSRRSRGSRSWVRKATARSSARSAPTT
jgi:arabinogalactan oligomer/maltooligosaccharide transport system substrate-binding protein